MAGTLCASHFYVAKKNKMINYVQTVNLPKVAPTPRPSA